MGDQMNRDLVRTERDRDWRVYRVVFSDTYCCLRFIMNFIANLFEIGGVSSYSWCSFYDIHARSRSNIDYHHSLQEWLTGTHLNQHLKQHAHTANQHPPWFQHQRIASPPATVNRSIITRITWRNFHRLQQHTANDATNKMTCVSLGKTVVVLLPFEWGNLRCRTTEV